MNSFGPAWDDFVECLTNGSIFAIITARGHEKEGMKKGVEYVIDSLDKNQKKKMHDSLLMFLQLFGKSREEESYESIVNFSQSKLVQDYLNLCHFIGVSAPSRGGSPENPEAAKEEALKDFIVDVNNYASKIGYSAKVGFSDDDPGNVRHMTHALSSKDLDHEKLWPFISEFVIKDTNLPSNVVKTSIPTREPVMNFGEFKESMDPMATSTMSMQTPNAAMSAGLDSKEPFVTRAIGQSKLLAKTSKGVFGNNKKKD
jgi:hypothetical protein